MDGIPAGLCQCGCGGKTSISKRFIKGHSRRNNNLQIKDLSNPSGMCKCGCGRKTFISKITRRERGQVAGQPVAFIKGHCFRMYPCVLDSVSPEYHTWQAMMKRCNNVKSPNFKNYGGRGIKVVGKMRTYAGFIEVMGKRPGDGYSLERIENNGNYEDGNVKWATRRDQARNRRGVLLTIETAREVKKDLLSGMSPVDAAKKWGIRYYHAYSILKGRAWAHL